MGPAGGRSVSRRPRADGDAAARRSAAAAGNARAALASDPEALGGLLEAAGFSEVEVEETQVTMEWASPEEFTTFVHEIAPPIRAMIDPHPQEVQDETWMAITEAIAQRAADDGTVTLRNVSLLASGRA